MSATVTIEYYEKILKQLIEINPTLIDKKCRIVPYVWGKHGIGKTEITSSVATELWMNYVVLNLACQTPEDLLGFPDGKGGFITPTWFQKRLKEGMRVEVDGKFGSIIKINGDIKVQFKDDDTPTIVEESKITIRPTLYFLDEINRAPKYVLQSMFNFVNEGRFHEHKMSKFDFIVAAGNPSDVDYEVTDFTDKAFLSRFAHFYLEPPASEFLSFLENSDGHQAVAKTLRMNPDFDGFNAKTNIDYKIHTEPDNRGLYKISQLLNILNHQTIKDIGQLLFSAMIGEDYARLIIQEYENLGNLITADELLMYPSKLKYPFDKNDHDTIMVINSNLAKHLATNKIDKTNVSQVNKLNKKEQECFQRYLKYIPREAELVLLSNLKKHIGSLVIEFFSELFGEEYIDNLLESKV